MRSSTPGKLQRSIYQFLTAKVESSRAIQRQFEASSQKLLTSKPPSDHLLTDNFSYYHIVASDDLVLDIRHDDDTRLNLPGRQRLLARALIFYTGRIDVAGRDSPLNGICFIHNERGVALEVMDDNRFVLTYGMAFDALCALVQFFQTRPTRNGETVALIRIPSMSPVREEDPVGYILLGQDSGLTAKRRCIGGSWEAR